jgi:hypothetical protein
MTVHLLPKSAFFLAAVSAVAVASLAGTAAFERGGAPTPAAAAGQTVPVGVIPGAPAGSPDQTPDSSGFNYASLFHEMTPDDTTGFTQIFDGRTLSGWDGDPVFWRVENGSIVGESAPQKRVAENTFLIWRGERLRDFELKIDFRINGTNSGVQVRSAELPSVGRWVLKGYQADMDFTNGFTGNIHEERGRDRPGRQRSRVQVGRPHRGGLRPARRAQRQQLESLPHHRQGPDAGPNAERPADGRSHRRRHGEPRSRRRAGSADARGGSVQGRVPERVVQAALTGASSESAPDVPGLACGGILSR